MKWGGWIASAAITIAFAIIAFTSTDNKNGYADIPRLLGEFEMQKEMSIRLDKSVNARKTVLDSMEVTLKAMTTKMDAVGAKEQDVLLFEKLREDYFLTKERFEEETMAQANEYDEQILNQLNQYVKDYGKENGYTYIFGVMGNGNILYAHEGEDLTEHLKVYINAKYKGK